MKSWGVVLFLSLIILLSQTLSFAVTFQNSKEFVVKDSDSYEIKLNEGDRLDFCLKVKGGKNNDVNLLVENDNGKEIIKMGVMDEHCTYFNADITGTYTFTFDNKFSTIAKKNVTLEYNISKSKLYTDLDQIKLMLKKIEDSITLNNNTTSCSQIFSYSMDCEISNQATLVIEAIMGVGLGISLGSYFYIKQKKHAEFLAKITRNVTEKVYTKNIDSYECTFSFYELEDGHAERARDIIKKIGDEWVWKFVKRSELPARTYDLSGFGMVDDIQLDGEKVTISKPHITQANFAGKLWQSATIRILTGRYEMMDKIIKEGKRPYWNVRWYISGKYDTHQLISKIEEMTGRQPSSKSGTGGGSDVHWGSATYKIMDVVDGGATVVTSIHEDFVDLTYYVYDPNRGFYRAHEIFNPPKIISFLFGEVSIPEVRIMLENSCKPY